MNFVILHRAGLLDTLKCQDQGYSPLQPLFNIPFSFLSCVAMKAQMPADLIEKFPRQGKKY